MRAMIPPAGEDTNEPSLVVRNRELAERPDPSPDDDDDVAGPDVGDLASHEPAARVDEHVEPIDGRAVVPSKTRLSQRSCVVRSDRLFGWSWSDGLGSFFGHSGPRFARAASWRWRISR